MCCFRREYGMDMAPYGYLLATVLGAAVGSFLNVVILRLPKKGVSIAFPGSHCPVCLKPLRWHDNIPILSYLLLKGRCRMCGGSISAQYPAVEVMMTLLSVAVFYRFGISFEAALYFLFVASLLVIIFIDIHHQIIPDRISLPGVLVGFMGSFVNQHVSWQESGLGILLGGGVLYLVASGYYALARREGMGGGDIKLLAMIGAFLGWQSLLFVIFSSSVAGSIVGLIAMKKQKKGGQTRIPYGPFLAMGAMAYLFFQDHINQLWHLYLTLGKM